jgi:hypothetical protein
MSLDRFDLACRSSALTSRPLKTKLRVDFRLLFLIKRKFEQFSQDSGWELLSQGYKKEFVCEE